MDDVVRPGLGRPTVSAVVLTKNEENNIRACLSSVTWADEVIVVDAESTDRTVAIAKEFTGRIFVRSWQGFPSQRNFGIAQAGSEWILIVDADERVTKEAKEEIEEWLTTPEAGDCVAAFVPRRNFVFGKWLRFGGLYPDMQCRVLKKGEVHYEEGTLDTPVISGPQKVFTKPFNHFTGETVQVRTFKVCRQSSYKAREKLAIKEQVSWYDVLFRPIFTFIKFYLLKRGFQDRIEGGLYAVLASFHTFLCYAKMWELANVRPDRVDNLSKSSQGNL